MDNATAAAADDDDDDDDISVGFAEGDTAVSLVIISTRCEDRQVNVSKKLLYRRPLQKLNVQH